MIVHPEPHDGEERFRKNQPVEGARRNWLGILLSGNTQTKAKAAASEKTWGGGRKISKRKNRVDHAWSASILYAIGSFLGK